MKKYRYEVWALGFNYECMCTEVEEFLGEFDNVDDAIAHAEKFKDISYVYDKDTIDNYLEKGDYLEIVVEKIDVDDLCCANEETVYTNYIYMPEEV